MIETPPVGLDGAQRSALERLVIRARVPLETDLAAQAEGRFGIHVDGTVEDEASLPDDTTDKISRRDLEEVVAHLRSLGEDAPAAVARLLREASFTHLNRLVAIRIAEAVGLLPESLAAGPQSRGFKDVGEIMPMLADDYRAYVRLCGDELAADAPACLTRATPSLPSNRAQRRSMSSSPWWPTPRRCRFGMRPTHWDGLISSSTRATSVERCAKHPRHATPENWLFAISSSRRAT